MVNKVAILIDAGYFKVRFREINNGIYPKIKDIKNYIDTVLQKVRDKSDPIEQDILFRTFYYDCRPFGDTITHIETHQKIDYSKMKSFTQANAILNELRKVDKLALRLGDLSFSGWKIEKDASGKYIHKPDLKQKSVDMKIGLDIAWLSSKKIVDKIVLVAGDSDFIAAMKFARKEGIIVYLDTIGQNIIKASLIEHADFIL